MNKVVVEFGVAVLVVAAVIILTVGGGRAAAKKPNCGHAGPPP
jgi:hypothetical protein